MLACGACTVLLPSAVVNVVGAVVVAVGNIHHNRKVVVAVADNTAAYFRPVHLVLYPMNTREEETGELKRLTIVHGKLKRLAIVYSKSI